VTPFQDVYAKCFGFVWASIGRLGVEAAGVEDVIQEGFIAIQRGEATQKNADLPVLAKLPGEFEEPKPEMLAFEAAVDRHDARDKRK